MQNVCANMFIKIIQLGLATILMAPILAVADTSTSISKFVRFEFSNYEGEGTFTLYRLDINLKSRLGQFCFLNSTNVNMPNELAGIVYKDEPWTGHFDFDKEKNKACFDVQLANAVDWFSSPKPIAYGGYEYQLFFVGKITPTPLDSGTYALTGDLDILMRRESESRGKYDIFTNAITLNTRSHPLASPVNRGE